MSKITTDQGRYFPLRVPSYRQLLAIRYYCYIWLMLILVSLSLRIMRLERVKLVLKRMANWRRRSKSGLQPMPQAVALSKLVSKIAYHSPLRAMCLEQSLVVWHLLLRQNIESDINIGARIEANALKAHAWLTIAGQQVIPTEPNDTYVPLRPEKHFTDPE